MTFWWLWLSVPFGAALVALGLIDMGLAVLHIERESPVSNRLSRATWRCLVWCGRHLPEEQRGRLLSWGIPLLVGGTIAFWAALFVVGFGLMFWPAMPDLFTIKDRPVSPAFEDAMYFSGVSFFTLGYGDVVPAHPLLRALASLEGAAGLLTIGLSVAYIVAIFPIIMHKIVLAASLNQEMGGKSHGMTLARRYLAVGRAEALAERLARINEELLFIGQAHAHYPLLFYVRPREIFDSFVRILALVQGIVSLRYTLDVERHADLISDPRLENLEEGLLSTLHGLEDSIHLRVPDDLCDAPGEAQAMEDFAGLLRIAEREGLTPVPPGAPREKAFRGYARFRHATDPFIRAYARSSAYPEEAVWATFSRAKREAAPTALERDVDTAHRRAA